jgi:hypothetical protein
MERRADASSSPHTASLKKKVQVAFFTKITAISRKKGNLLQISVSAEKFIQYHRVPHTKRHIATIAL